jgi:predicted aldo/keto reductase-like oxidoreductase
MEYRKLGPTGFDVGVIGLGTEHLRQEPETMAQVLGAAVAAGANYVDLLYVDVHGDDARFWKALGPALRAQRDRLILAAHWGNGPRCDIAYCQRTFEDVLAQTGNGYAEVGLLTMVDDNEKWNGWAQESIAYLRRYQEQGRVGAIALSTHETAVARQAVASGAIDVLMFPVNMLDADDAERQALYRACAERGVGLVAMKPYHGGTLLSVNGRPSGITPTHCLAYVLSLPVATAVPGPSDLAEWQATLHYLEATDAEKDYRPVSADLPGLLAGQCVYCMHCLPCPQDISIGWTIWLVDQLYTKDAAELAPIYADYQVKASACTECGLCLERCPFGVDILGKLRQAVEVFEGG